MAMHIVRAITKEGTEEEIEPMSTTETVAGGVLHHVQNDCVSSKPKNARARGSAIRLRFQITRPVCPRFAAPAVRPAPRSGVYLCLPAGRRSAVYRAAGQVSYGTEP